MDSEISQWLQEHYRLMVQQQKAEIWRDT